MTAWIILPNHSLYHGDIWVCYEVSQPQYQLFMS